MKFKYSAYGGIIGQNNSVKMDKLFAANGAPASNELSVQKADDGVIETDFLIVGTGPSGGSLACFLASHGGQLIPFVVQ